MKCIKKQEEVDEVLHAMVHCNDYNGMIELANIINSGKWERMPIGDQDELLDYYYGKLNK